MTSQEELVSRLDERDSNRPFSEALASPGLSLIAEFKRRSPSAGVIATPDLTEQLAAYERGGAAAISVLTDETHFGGNLADLEAARRACRLPILRKDFIVDAYQLYEAAAAGADAVLLIVRALDDDEFHRLHETARELDLDCLTEVHDARELDRALEQTVEVIGINNRNLDTGTVDLATTFELMPDVPAGQTVVSESGIGTRDQMEELQRIGVDAVLIGESLMRSDDPETLVRNLAAEEEATREHHLP